MIEITIRAGVQLIPSPVGTRVKVGGEVLSLTEAIDRGIINLEGDNGDQRKSERTN